MHAHVCAYVPTVVIRACLSLVHTVHTNDCSATTAHSDHLYILSIVQSDSCYHRCHRCPTHWTRRQGLDLKALCTAFTGAQMTTRQIDDAGLCNPTYNTLRSCHSIWDGNEVLSCIRLTTAHGHTSIWWHLPVSWLWHSLLCQQTSQINRCARSRISCGCELCTSAAWMRPIGPLIFWGRFRLCTTGLSILQCLQEHTSIAME